mgnify:CR=1 FL=1
MFCHDFEYLFVTAEVGGGVFEIFDCICRHECVVLCASVVVNVILFVNRVVWIKRYAVLFCVFVRVSVPVNFDALVGGT